MKKGISPIVSVVLLIAIAVVAAVGLYFWMGGLATKQPTPNVPIVISANPIDPGSGTILIANLGSSPLTVSELQTTDDTFTKCLFDGEVTIDPGEHASCMLATETNVTGPVEGEIIIYAENTGSANAMISMPERVTVRIPLWTSPLGQTANYISFPFETDGTIISLKSVREFTEDNNQYENSTFTAHDFVAALDDQDCNPATNPSEAEMTS